MTTIRRAGYLVAFLALILLLIALLAQWRMPLDTVEQTLAVEFLNDKKNGDIALVAMQTALDQSHYQNADSLMLALDRWFGALRAALPQDQALVVVLPEHIGTWLVAADEAWLTYQLPSTSLAFGLPILRQPRQYFRHWQAVAAPDRFTAALFQLKADAMWASYHRVMGELARRHRLTLVAGSIVVPNVTLTSQGATLGTGALYNQSAIFSPAGEIIGMVAKHYPIEDELAFVSAANRANVKIETVLGPTQIMICADSWYPQSWQATDANTVVLVPSLLFDASLWQQAWQGYNGAPIPADVDRNDIGRLKEYEAWERYALAGRGQHLRAGINVFGHDHLWQMQGAGQTLALAQGKVYRGAAHAGVLASVLWISPIESGLESKHE